MRGYEAAQILKEKGITVEDVAEEITYRKETNALSKSPKKKPNMNKPQTELERGKHKSTIKLNICKLKKERRERPGLRTMQPGRFATVGVNVRKPRHPRPSP